MEIAALGFRIDSSDAKRAVTDLGTLTAQAGSAETAAQELGAAATGAASRIRSLGAEGVQAAASTRSIAGAAQQAALQMGALERSALGAGSRLAMMPNQISGIAAATGVAGHQMQNLSFQIGDIATQLASGQSPFRVLAQQGMQVAGVFGPGTTLMGAVRGFGAAIGATLTNPITLGIGAITLATGAAEMFFNRSREEAIDTEAVLQRHVDLIGRFREAYGEAALAAQGYGEQVDITLGTELRASLEANQQALRSSAETLFEELTERNWMDPGMTMLFGTEGPGADREILERFRPFFSALQYLEDQLDEARPDVVTFIEMVNAVAEARPDNGALQQAANEVFRMAQGAKDFADAIAESEAALGGVAAGAAGVTFPTHPQPRPSPLTDLTYNGPAIPGVIEDPLVARREAERAQEAIDRVTDSLRFQAAQLGRTAAEQSLYNQLRAAGTTLDTEAGREIAGLVQQMALLERQTAVASLFEDQARGIAQTALEASLVGASAVDRAHALADFEAMNELREAGLDLASREADTYRQNAAAQADAVLALDRRTAAQKELNSAIGEGLEGLTDWIASGASIRELGAVVEDVLGDVCSEIMELEIEA